MNSNGSKCLITVDGTDFMINEPSPRDEKWYSEKFEHAGLTYEVGICLQTGWIVWVNGPFAAGEWNDIAIARCDLHEMLDRREMYVADKGYKDSNGWALAPTVFRRSRPQHLLATARARHEDVNGCFKEFGILRNCFDLHRTKHGRVFRACAEITQAKIQLERTTFQVHYHELWNRMNY